MFKAIFLATALLVSAPAVAKESKPEATIFVTRAAGPCAYGPRATFQQTQADFAVNHEYTRLSKLGYKVRVVREAPDAIMQNYRWESVKVASYFC